MTGLSWAGIARLGLAQLALGALSVLATSTLNRIMVVELALPALIPGLLIGLHYGLQTLRPGWGFYARGGDRWIVGGTAVLAAGVLGAAAAMALTASYKLPGIALVACCYGVIGLGIGAAGTATLARLAGAVAPQRRPAAAMIAWLMMILGIGLGAGLAGRVLQPFSFAALIRLAAWVGVGGLGLSLLATWRTAPAVGAAEDGRPMSLRAVLGRLQADPSQRRFAGFVFLAMLAFSGQELLLEPFAGLVFGLPPSGTAALIGLQQAGMLLGMVLVGLMASIAGTRFGSMRLWTMGGCAGSAACLIMLALLGPGGLVGGLRPCLFGLGLANGAFAVSVIGAMMQIAGDRGDARETGAAMGVFGAAQALAMGAGGLLGSGAADLARLVLGSPVMAYAVIFMAEAALFAVAAALAGGIFSAPPAPRRLDVTLEVLQ